MSANGTGTANGKISSSGNSLENNQSGGGSSGQNYGSTRDQYDSSNTTQENIQKAQQADKIAKAAQETADKAKNKWKWYQFNQSDKILWLLDHPQERVDRGEYGYNKIINELSWKFESRKLVDFYKKVVKAD